VFGSLPELGALQREWETNLSGYLADEDPDHLTNAEIPYVSSERLIEYLQQPELRAILPSSVRQSGPPGLVSVAAARLAAAGWVIVAIGLAGWLFILGRELRTIRPQSRPVVG